MAVSFNQMNSYPVAGQNLQKANNAQQAQIAAQTIVQDSFEKQTAQNVAQTPPNAMFKGSSTSETKPFSLGQGAAVFASGLLGGTAGAAGGYWHAWDTMPFFKDGVPSDEFVKLYSENLTKQGVSLSSNLKNVFESFNYCESADDFVSSLTGTIRLNAAFSGIEFDSVKKSGLESFVGILDEQSKRVLENAKTWDEFLTIFSKELESAIKAKGLENIKKEYSKLFSSISDEVLAKQQLMTIFDSQKKVFSASSEKQAAALKDTVSHFCHKPAFIWAALGAAVLGGATMLYCYFKNKSAAPETQKLDAKV